jgi:hypothetical protein
MTFDPMDSSTHDPSCFCHRCTGGRMDEAVIPMREESLELMMLETDHGDECPLCQCGTVEHTEDEIKCRGECGVVVQKVASRPFKAKEGTIRDNVLRAVGKLNSTEEVIQHFSGVNWGRLINENNVALGVINSLANCLWSALSIIREGQRAMAKPLRDHFPVSALAALPDGTTAAVVPCSDHEMFESLPPALEIAGDLYGKTGWNSDRGVAYYRTDAIMGRAV